MTIITRTVAVGRTVAAAALTLALAGAASAQGQQSDNAGAGRWEISAIPGGGIFFTERDAANAPDFSQYALGAAATFNVNRRIGVEGEFAAGIGIDQELRFGSSIQRDAKIPHTLAYNGNVVVSPWGSDRRLVPYGTGGAGGLTLLSRDDVASLGVTDDATFFTGNVGGGVKWFATRRFGVRADYRFIGVRSKDDAPAFFGLDETRFGHRVYGGIVLTGGK